MKSLTPRQRDILIAWRSYEREHGFAPTQRELSVLIGISPSSGQAVQDHLAALARKGFVERGPRNVARAGRLTLAAHEELAKLSPAAAVVIVLFPRRCMCGAETYAAPSRGCFECERVKAGAA